MHIDLQQLTVFASVALMAPCHPLDERVPQLGVEQRALSSTPELPSAERSVRPGTSASRGHSAEATELRRAAIAGELGMLQREAARIAADAWSARLPAGSSQRIEPVRGAARAVLAAPTVSEAALALGALGSACARCHHDVGGPVSPDEPSNDTTDEMAAHGDAEEALWVGLAYPSDSRWLSAARALSSGPTLDSDVV